MSKQNSLLTRAVSEVLPSADSLNELMSKKKIRVYFGIDPSGAFLTLGHSIALRKLQAFADAGHEAILLIGNGTVRIGDPTGKDASRPVLSNEEIEKNFKDWQKQASKILNFNKIKVLRNGDWLDKLNYADIIKLLAKTTVQQLLERDMFRERLKAGKPIHGHEIIYPLIQGYDSTVMDVDLEIGGTDQTFNMMMGRTLQKAYNNKEKWVLTTPIINGTDGRKMSKSFNNYVALTDDPNDMYGKLMSISDDQIISYFELLTDIDLSKIAEMKKAMSNGENPMDFKKQLAFEITKMYHDKQHATEAQIHFEVTTQKKKTPKDISTFLLEPAINKILGILSVCMPWESKSNLRRLVEQGAVQLMPQEIRIMDQNQIIKIDKEQIFKVGKRNFFRVKYKK
ncbi:MAG: tyrosine--tRNA ligase [Patescibacteria group bacterium]